GAPPQRRSAAAPPGAGPAAAHRRPATRGAGTSPHHRTVRAGVSRGLLPSARMSVRGSTASRLTAAALALAMLLVLLAALEAGLRVTGHGPPPLPSPFTGEGALGGEASGALPDDELFYRLRPGTQFLDYYRINALGY